VQGYLYRWRDDGTWQRIDARPVARARQRQGRTLTPSAGIIDSQSVPASQSGGPRGIDAGKRIKGGKRHIVTDTKGFRLAVRVHDANIQDPHGAVPLLRSLRQAFPKLDYRCTSSRSFATSIPTKCSMSRPLRMRARLAAPAAVRAERSSGWGTVLSSGRVHPRRLRAPIRDRTTDFTPVRR